VIPPGRYVYEFDSGTDNHHKKPILKDGKILQGEYVHNGPGFLKTKNPDGQCSRFVSIDVDGTIVFLITGLRSGVTVVPSTDA
jgi:hypothetical protein